MTRYTATIAHHSISSAPVIEAGDTLAAAKRRATREFGDGFGEHEIIITDTTIANPWGAIVSRRRCDAARWSDA